MKLEFLRKAKRSCEAFMTTAKQAFLSVFAIAYDGWQFLSYAGALHHNRRAAARSEIVMGYHVLEKGLTMPNRRLGFGRAAVVHLVNLIKRYEERFGRGDGQVEHAACVLSAYERLHRGKTDPIPALEEFLSSRGGQEPAVEPHETRDDFFAEREAPFPRFAASRHVCRHFAPGAVPRFAINKAVELAQTAPSACNRQHVRVHAVDDAALKERLLALQGGSRGFGQDAGLLLVVTSDLSAVRWAWERHDAYTNGGIFVMNLCYALHYFGLAHCILHWSVSPARDRAAHKLLGIPPNEAIVQVIACGPVPAEFDIAASPRRATSEILTWHGGDK